MQNDIYVRDDFAQTSLIQSSLLMGATPDKPVELLLYPAASGIAAGDDGAFRLGKLRRVYLFSPIAIHF